MDWKNHSFNWQTESLLREMTREIQKAIHRLIRVFVAKTFIGTKVTAMILQGIKS